MLLDLIHHNGKQLPLGNNLLANSDAGGFCSEADEELSCIPFNCLVQRYCNKLPGIQPQSEMVIATFCTMIISLWFKYNQNRDTLMHISTKQQWNKSSSHPAVKVLVWNFSLTPHFTCFGMILQESFSLSMHLILACKEIFLFLSTTRLPLFFFYCQPFGESAVTFPMWELHSIQK